MVLSFNLLAVLPAAAAPTDNNKAKPQTDEDRCKKFRDQFNIGSGSDTVNIAEGIPIYCTPNNLIINITNYLLMFSGTITVLFVVIGGFWYLTSAGNEEQAEKGKKTLINSVIGLVVIILSAAIVRIVAGTLSLGK